MSGALWDFALKFYASAPVQASCLALQDECGADVNVVLCLLWQGRGGVALDPEKVAGLDAAVEPWRDVAVRPLRDIRRRLKGTPAHADARIQEAFRSEIKAIELRSERLELDMLEQACGDPRGEANPADAARRNLEAYAGLLANGLSGDAVETLLARLAELS